MPGATGISPLCWHRRGTLQEEAQVCLHRLRGGVRVLALCPGLLCYWRRRLPTQLFSLFRVYYVCILRWNLGLIPFPVNLVSIYRLGFVCCVIVDEVLFCFWWVMWIGCWGLILYILNICRQDCVNKVEWFRYKIIAISFSKMEHSCVLCEKVCRVFHNFFWVLVK